MNSLEDLKQAGGRRGSFFRTVSAVLWSFFGVRKSASHDADVATLNPLHVIIVGIVLGILFVLTLVFLVQMVVQ
ncbi:MAG: hypothetical protein RLZZ344_1043 [Pseudomonadota bacterium]|jgi:amino acid transporter